MILFQHIFFVFSYERQLKRLLKKVVEKGCRWNSLYQCPIMKRHRWPFNANASANINVWAHVYTTYTYENTHSCTWTVKCMCCSFICAYFCVSECLYLCYIYVCMHIYTYLYVLTDDNIQGKQSQKTDITYRSAVECLPKEALIFVSVLICLSIFSVPRSRTLL